MSEIIDGGYCYENIRRNAYWYNAHLDTTFRPDVDFADTFISHYGDCKENSTLGLLARKTTETKNYPHLKLRNEELYNRFEGVREAKDSFEKTFNKNYPKTGKARKYLIDKEFVVLDYVKPLAKTFGRKMFKLFGR